MIGGEKETVDYVRPLLEKVSAVIVHAGPSGAGSTLKLVNNLIMGVAIEAVAEALVFARKAGIDPDCVRQITSVGGARTAAMETRGSHMLAHDFSPHFSTDNMHKDLSTALRLADAVGAVAPAASAALEVLRAARAQGKGSLDSAVVYTVIEQLCGLPPQHANYARAGDPGWRVDGGQCRRLLQHRGINRNPEPAPEAGDGRAQPAGEMLRPGSGGISKSRRFAKISNRALNINPEPIRKEFNLVSKLCRMTTSPTAVSVGT